MPEHHGLNKPSGFSAFCHYGHKRQRGDRFGRLFDLPPVFTPAPVLHAIGVQGGPMDGGTSAKRTQTVDVGHKAFVLVTGGGVDAAGPPSRSDR